MRSEYKRSRIYYSKAQIENGLLTEGQEWMTVDNIEYIGQYHKYITGEVFTQPTFVDCKSRKLIPFVDLANLGQQNEIGIDIAKNFEYDNIKQVDVLDTLIPNPNIEPITDDDLINGFFQRYFGYRYDGRCIELNKESYNKIGSDEGLTDVQWKGIKLNWKIKGPVRDIKDSNGKMIEAGVFDTNKRTVFLLSEDFPNFRVKLLDYLEFYQP